VAIVDRASRSLQSVCELIGPLLPWAPREDGIAVGCVVIIGLFLVFAMGRCALLNGSVGEHKSLPRGSRLWLV